MEKHKCKVGAIILAGGQSTRMGFPKIYLPLYEQLMINHIMSAYRDIADYNIIVLNEQYSKDEWHSFYRLIRSEYQIAINTKPEKGKLYSIQLGIKALPNNVSYSFVQTCDHIVNSATLESMLSTIDDNDISTPLFNGKQGHPLLLSRTLLHDLSTSKNYDEPLNQVLAKYHRKAIEVPDPNTLINLNTTADYLQFLKEYSA